MAKSICVIYFPCEFTDASGRKDWIYKYMAFLNGEYTAEMKQSDQFMDYHWFCFYKDEITEPEFKVFHEKDFTDIQYTDLKKLVTESLNIKT